MFKKLGVIGGALAILAVGAATAADWSLVQDDMKFMREEEKLARDVYATLYDFHLDKGLTLTVCDNIAYSEQRHMDAMKQLLDNYDIADSAVEGGREPTRIAVGTISACSITPTSATFMRSWWRTVRARVWTPSWSVA